MSKFAVTGASGKLGGATIACLLERRVAPGNIVAVVRNPARNTTLTARGIQVRQGDYTDPASLERALQGVRRLAFVSTSALGDERMLHHRNVVNAARAAGVGHIFYTSVIKPAAVAKFAASPGHFHTEALIRDSGISHSFFRNNLYLDLIPLMFSAALATGTLLNNTGDGRIGFVARNDIAAALAAVLSSPERPKTSYDITAKSPYNLAQVAQALGKAAGKSITYQPLSTADFREALAKAGVPGPVIEMSVALGEAARAGEFDAGSGDLQALLGREPTSLEAFLADALRR